MFELHRNFTFQGSKTVVDGQYPTEHQLHKTLEITHGFRAGSRSSIMVVNAGFEYYGALGPNFSPKRDFNFGVGVSLTGGTDHMLAKMILGRRVTTK
jgi:hypothetical protein